jgi:Ca2+-binding RTX toxin-like protein
MRLNVGSYPVNMLDPDYLGLGDFYPDPDPQLVVLSASEIKVRDRITNATVSLFGQFTIQDGALLGGTINRMTWRSGSNELLLDLSNFSLPVDTDIVNNLELLFAGNDIITGGPADDVLLGFQGDDLVRGGQGNDLLLGMEGRDTLEGGQGNDILLSADEPQWSADFYQASYPMLSGDGRYLVVQGSASLFGYQGEPGQLAFFRGNLETFEVTRELEPFNPGEIFELPVLSGDGSLLTFIGPATMAGEPGSSYPQLLLANLDTDTVTLVSLTLAGEQAGYLPESPAISADGSTLAFVYLDSDLVNDDENGLRDIFYVRDGGSIERASVTAEGEDANGPSTFPVLSGDGRLLAFASAATNLTADVTSGWAAFVRNLETNEIQRIATLANPSNFAFDIGPSPLALSDNGRFLAFVSADSTLVENDFNDVADVFVLDLLTGETVRASEDIFGIGGNVFSDQPAISGNGRYVAFLTTSIWEGDLSDTNFRPDVFIKDLFTGSLTRIPVPGHDGVGSIAPSQPQLSFDGSNLIFHYGSDGTVLSQLDNDGAHIMRGQSGDDFYIMLRQEIAQELPDHGYDTIVGLFSEPYQIPDNIEAFAHALDQDNQITGNTLNNRFIGGGGNEHWNGADGIDILSFQTLYEEAVVSASPAGWTVSGPGSGTDYLESVERIEFTDLGLALDIDGNAKAAFSLLYVALAEVPDPSLVTQWLNDFDAGFNSTQVAQHLLDFYAPQFPGGIPNDLLVSALWQNLVGTPIPVEELQNLTSLLSSGQVTQAQLLAAAAEHPLNQEAVEPLIALGVIYQPDPFDWNSGVWEGALF